MKGLSFPELQGEPDSFQSPPSPSPAQAASHSPSQSGHLLQRKQKTA